MPGPIKSWHNWGFKTESLETQPTTVAGTAAQAPASLLGEIKV